ncbi:hypothetical protein VNO77_03112 [Canavalia gladiata]|uniref:Uncharacterized protein n=1 Tax=Canavalia gladiata TaxID=3824 RepID=A0AAN9MUX9_CANGL
MLQFLAMQWMGQIVTNSSLQLLNPMHGSRNWGTVLYAEKDGTLPILVNMGYLSGQTWIEIDEGSLETPIREWADFICITKLEKKLILSIKIDITIQYCQPWLELWAIRISQEYKLVLLNFKKGYTLKYLAVMHRVACNRVHVVITDGASLELLQKENVERLMIKTGAQLHG